MGGQFASTLMAMTAPISCVSKLFFDRVTALIGEFMGNQNSNPLGFMAIVKRTLPPPYIAILNAGAHVYSTMNQSTPKDKPKINATENMAGVFERPPGVPFQKIQFGNERGGRSVLSRLPELRIARILALLRCLILCPSVCLSATRKFV